MKGHEKRVDPPAVAEFEAIAGRGVIAKLERAEIAVGTPDFLAERGVAVESSTPSVNVSSGMPGQPSASPEERHLVRLLGLGDALRADVVDAIERLHRAGAKTDILTGDREVTARRIAEQAG